MDKLLQEAIADAKAVRETALANAKIALEEAFTPHLKSMLSKKLQAEMEGEDEEKEAPAEGYADEDDEEVNEEADSSEIGAADNKEPAGDAGDTSGIGQGPESEGSDEEGGNEDENLEKAPDQALGENEEPGMEDEEMEEAPDQPMKEEEGIEDEDEEIEEGEHMEDEDEDLEEVLRQLEAEMGMEDEDEEGMEAEYHHGEGEHMEDEDEEMKEEEGMEDEDDEIDLDEIIKALTEEEGMEDEDEDIKEEEGMEDEEASELEEYKQTVQYLKDKLSEVNLLNAKLLYTNKLFRSRNVSEAQKMKVIEQFDRAANVREVKLVYSTFAESIKRKSVNESAKRVSKASKPVASTKSANKSQIIGENTDFRARMKKLANII